VPVIGGYRLRRSTIKNKLTVLRYKWPMPRKKWAGAQSRTHSLIEALVNVAVGYCIAVTAQIIVFPIFGVHISLRQNIEIGIIMTVISIAARIPCGACSIAGTMPTTIDTIQATSAYKRFCQRGPGAARAGIFPAGGRHSADLGRSALAQHA
jgi:hypothetical protein